MKRAISSYSILMWHDLFGTLGKDATATSKVLRAILYKHVMLLIISWCVDDVLDYTQE